MAVTAGIFNSEENTIQMQGIVYYAIIGVLTLLGAREGGLTVIAFGK